MLVSCLNDKSIVLYENDKIHTLQQGWPNYSPQASQIACKLFSSTTFLTVDSSATALAAACLLSTFLPQQYLAASSAIKV